VEETIVDPSSKWKSLKDYLTKKQESVFTTLKSAAGSGKLESVLVESVRFSLIEEIIAQAELLDRDKPVAGRNAPPLEKY
jgi:hypothetical protein